MLFNIKFGPLIIILDYLSVVTIFKNKIYLLSKNFLKVSEISLKNRFIKINSELEKLNNNKLWNKLIENEIVNIYEKSYDFITKIELKSKIFIKIINKKKDLNEIISHLKEHTYYARIKRKEEKYLYLILEKNPSLIKENIDNIKKKKFLKNLISIYEKKNNEKFLNSRKTIIEFLSYNNLEIVKYMIEKSNKIEREKISLSLINGEFIEPWREHLLNFIIKKKYLTDVFIYEKLINNILLKGRYKILNLINLINPKKYEKVGNKIIEANIGEQTLRKINYHNFKVINLSYYLISKIRNAKIANEYLCIYINRTLYYNTNKYIFIIAKIINLDFIKKASKKLRKKIFSEFHNKTIYFYVKEIFKSYNCDYNYIRLKNFIKIEN
jgi:hypothetical protein